MCTRAPALTLEGSNSDALQNGDTSTSPYAHGAGGTAPCWGRIYVCPHANQRHDKLMEPSLVEEAIAAMATVSAFGSARSGFDIVFDKEPELSRCAGSGRVG